MAKLVIFADVDDGMLNSTAALRADAQSGAGTITVTTVIQTPDAGQDGGPPATAGCYETFLGFDTSAMGSTVFTAVTFRIADSGSTGTFTGEIRLHSWSPPLAIGQWVPCSALAAKQLLANVASTVVRVAPNVYYDWVTQSGAVAALNTSGFTRMVMCTADMTNQAANDTNSNLCGTISADGSLPPKIILTGGVFSRAIGALGSASTGDLTLTYPTGIVSGDRFIAVITTSDNIASTRTGWTLKQGTNNGTGLRTEIWYMDAASDGTETGTLVWTRASGLTSEGRIYAIAGSVASGDPIEAINSSANSSSTTVAFSALTTVSNGALVVAVASAAGVATASGYSGTDPTFVEESDDTIEPRPFFVDSNAVGMSSAGTTLTMTIPSAAIIGDVCLMTACVKSASATFTRTGWTTVQAVQGDAASPAARLFTLSHTVASGEPGSAIGFTIGASVKAAGVLSVWRNVNTTTPLNVGAGQVNASGTNSVVPTITPTAANTVLVYNTGPSTGETLTTQPGGYTKPTIATVAATGGSGATKCGVGIAYSLYPAQSATGTKTGVISAATTSAGVHLALAAATPTAVPVSQAVADDNKVTAGSTSSRTATLSVAAVNTGVLFAIKPPAGALFLQRLVMSQAVQRAASW